MRTLTDEGESGPAGVAKDCREGSGGFDDSDGGGLPLAIFEGTCGAAEDNAAVVLCVCVCVCVCVCAKHVDSFQNKYIIQKNIATSWA